MNETWEEYCQAYAFLSKEAFDDAPPTIWVRVYTEDGFRFAHVNKLTEDEYKKLNARACQLRAQVDYLDPDEDDDQATFETIMGEVAPLDIKLLVNAQLIKED